MFNWATWLATICHWERKRESCQLKTWSFKTTNQIEIKPLFTYCGNINKSLNMKGTSTTNASTNVSFSYKMVSGKCQTISVGGRGMSHCMYSYLYLIRNLYTIYAICLYTHIHTIIYCNWYHTIFFHFYWVIINIDHYRSLRCTAQWLNYINCGRSYIIFCGTYIS